ncbi:MULTISPECIES: hypothetical protein [unclassified Sphingomonas]|uniref:hypothetical protein n=1 Tax=unclassified Sphingomonas TaxID=196159 RepID=UPI0017BA4DB1|nr:MULTISPECIES: hypothetical protein [unclassified Sphingomonas]MBB3346922.1 hypothetical protein [Sphingomonas sp. BK069]MBB3471759.1 hypothetical protein [Sphingomonas sp. BK345]
MGRWRAGAIRPRPTGDGGFQEALAAYPGVIMASIILQPDGDLIPRTLRETGLRVPPHSWTARDFRDIDAYMKRGHRRRACPRWAARALTN